MKKIPKDELIDIFNHIKNECADDPLYVTKLIFEFFGRNIIQLVLRIAAYMAVYYVLTTFLHIPYGVSALLVLLVIMSYHSVIGMINKIRASVSKKNGSKDVK